MISLRHLDFSGCIQVGETWLSNTLLETLQSAPIFLSTCQFMESCWQFPEVAALRGQGNSHCLLMRRIGHCLPKYVREWQARSPNMDCESSLRVYGKREIA